VARGEAKPGRDASFAGRTPYSGAYLGNLPARFYELRTCCGVDRAVDASAPEHPLVRGVHDCVHRETSQIRFDYF
jgi:hypothetical protein